MMRVIHHDGRTGTALCHPDTILNGWIPVQFDGDERGKVYLPANRIRPLGPIEDELFRADFALPLVSQLSPEAWSMVVFRRRLARNYWREEAVSGAIEAARWLEDPEGNARELAMAREMGAIR